MRRRSLVIAVTAMVLTLCLAGCSGGAQTPERDIANNVLIAKQDAAKLDYRLDAKASFNGVTISLNSKWRGEKSQPGSSLPRMLYTIEKTYADSVANLITETYMSNETKDIETFTQYAPKYDGYTEPFEDEGEWTDGGCTYHVMSACNAEQDSYCSFLIGWTESGKGFSTRYFLSGRYANEQNIQLRNQIFSRITYDESKTDPSLCAEPSPRR